MSQLQHPSSMLRSHAASARLYTGKSAAFEMRMATMMLRGGREWGVGCGIGGKYERAYRDDTTCSQAYQRPLPVRVAHPKMPSADPKISTIRILTNSDESCASASAQPEPATPTQMLQGERKEQGGARGSLGLGWL
jgi:hypothetical protein